MSNLLHIPALLLAATLLNSCVSPSPISILNNKNHAENYWSQGQEIIRLQRKGLTMELGYDQESNGMLIFDVYIENQSALVYPVNPSLFRMTELDPYMDTVQVFSAISPQTEIYKMDRMISRNKAEQTNQALGSALSRAVELVATVSNEFNDNDHTEKNRVRAGLAYSRLNREMEARELNFEEMSLYDQRAYWETQSLRRTTLFPGLYVTGKVYFPKSTHTGLLILSFPIAEEAFQYRFEHLLAPVE